MILFSLFMVKKNFLPDEPDDWYLDKDSSKDIDLTRRKVSKDEQWLNRNIHDPDFERLFKRVKSFYRGSLDTVIKIPDDLSPVVDRAMEKFKFSSKYEALLYILTLKSCEYVADFISGTMYDFAVDHSIADLSGSALADLRSEFLESRWGGDKQVSPASFEGRAIDMVLTVAQFYEYIRLTLDVSPKESVHAGVDRLDFSKERSSDGVFGMFYYNSLHALALYVVRNFPGMSLEVVFEEITNNKESLSFEKARVRALIKEKVELQAKYSSDTSKYYQEMAALRSDLGVVRKRASSYEDRIDALNREIKALKDEYEHGLIFSLRSFFEWLERRFK